MSTTQPHYDVLKWFRKMGPLVSRGIVTVDEYTSNAFDTLAYSDHVDSVLVPEIWQLVPDQCRDALEENLRSSLLAEFRWHAFARSGPRPMTDEEIEKSRSGNTAQIQAWATEFVKFFDRGPSKSSN